MSNIVGSALTGFGGILRCEVCGTRRKLTPEAAGRYLANGWPKHHGNTMRWWTRRQIVAGEMPEVRHIRTLQGSP